MKTNYSAEVLQADDGRWYAVLKINGLIQKVKPMQSKQNVILLLNRLMEKFNNVQSNKTYQIPLYFEGKPNRYPLDEKVEQVEVKEKPKAKPVVINTSPKSKVILDDGLYRGYIYAEGRLIERTNSYFSKDNCIDYLNKRAHFWNSRKGWDIPEYTKEQANANA